MPSDLGAANPGKDPTDVSLIAILRRLSAKQWWGLGAAIVTLVVGLVALGGWVQASRDDDKIAEKNRTISRLSAEKNTATGQLNDAQRNLASVTAMLKQSASDQDALAGKAEFLERFLSYELAPESVSRKLFVDYVCALWKQSERHRVQIDRSPLHITDDQLRMGISPELRSFLIQSGVSEFFLQRASSPAPAPAQVFPSVSRTPVVSPTPGEAIATVQKQIQGMVLTKTIHFYDGTTYTVPQDVAFEVHNRPNCGPQ